ncbi:MAG: hypothetical protein PHE82_09175 [Syntrophomonadaceae bacterium]|nr:hypothetical protein [Syntrophomonadaceae bacterium]
MDYIRAEQVRDDMIGLRPVYSEIGNSTEVILDSGEVFLDKRGLNSVTKALARCYALDLKAQRQNIVQMGLGRRGILPFYIGNDRVFIALKMRNRVTGKDSVYGYVDVSYMGEPEEDDDKNCRVTLSNGVEIQVFSRRMSVISSLHMGKKLLGLLGHGKTELDTEGALVSSGRVIENFMYRVTRQLNNIESLLNKGIDQ